MSVCLLFVLKYNQKLENIFMINLKLIEFVLKCISYIEGICLKCLWYIKRDQYNIYKKKETKEGLLLTFNQKRMDVRKMRMNQSLT